MATSAESPESIETLRQLLCRQQAREVSYDEASEVGHSLVTFYELLAEAT